MNEKKIETISNEVTPGKSIYLKGLTPIHMSIIVISSLMICVSAYLTYHFFEANFPTSIDQASICTISSFFNCDSAAYSPVSNIFMIPISFFGFMLGFFLLLGSFIPNEQNEITNRNLALLNVAGCILLAGYSIFSIRSLCPFCTIYYVLSFVAGFIFLRFGIPSFRIYIKTLVTYGLITLLGVAMVLYFVRTKTEEQSSVTMEITSQFDALPFAGDPRIDSQFRLARATTNFKDAPLRLSFFSDFECPACKMLAEQSERVAKRFQKKVNIQYFFFPMDPMCNHNITGQFHEFACKKAALAACSGERFYEIHNALYANIHGGDEFIMNLAKSLGIEACLTSQAAMKILTEHVTVADDYLVQATPTLIINGKKLEGAININQMFALLEYILSKEQNTKRENITQ